MNKAKADNPRAIKPDRWRAINSGATEGDTLEFTVSRNMTNRSTALTVTVEVSEDGEMYSEAATTTVNFRANVASVTLSIATDGDEQA